MIRSFDSLSTPFQVMTPSDIPLATPKSSTLRNQLELSFAIIKCLGVSKKMSTQEIFELLMPDGSKSDKRRLQRTLKTLSESELISRFSKPGSSARFSLYHEEKENADSENTQKVLSISGLKTDQALMLSLINENLKVLLPEPAKSSLSSLLSHLEDFWERTTQHGSNARKASEWQNKVYFAPEVYQLQKPEIAPTVLETISEALYHNEYLTIGYQPKPQYKGKHQPIKHYKKLMPLGLVQQGNRLYLVCRLSDCDTECHLAIHRIKMAESEGVTFERPQAFSLEQYDQEGRFFFGCGEKKIEFSMSTKHIGTLLETPLSDDQTEVFHPAEDERGDFYRVSATVVDSVLLDRWLYAFHKDVWHINYPQSDES